LKILAIETSCDETSTAVVEDGRKILSSVIASQTDLHSIFGGVVPEVASRRHLEAVIPVISEALNRAECTLEDIDAIGVVNRPGLIGALIVGVSAAKAIAYSRNLTLIPVHHLEAHIYANWLTETEPQFPFVCLVVSGGHSDIVYAAGHGCYEVIARTRDDAAGEAFDKSARALGLGYPGGPIIDKLAKDGNPKAIHFPRARVGDSLDFSFSGIKTAVVRFAQQHADTFSMEDIAASFQQAVIDVLIDHTFKAAIQRNAKMVMIAGGVAANSGLQKAVKQMGIEKGIPTAFPPPILCTDNAAMVGAAAYFNYVNGITGSLDIDCKASEKLGTSTC